MFLDDAVFQEKITTHAPSCCAIHNSNVLFNVFLLKSSCKSSSAALGLLDITLCELILATFLAFGIPSRGGGGAEGCVFWEL